MVREFIVKNRRNRLQIVDSNFPNQTSNSTSDPFVDSISSLMGIGLSTFSEDLNNIRIFLRAGRSLYIKLDTESCKIEFRDIDTSPLNPKHIHPKRKNEDKENKNISGLQLQVENLKGIQESLVGMFDSKFGFKGEND